MERARLGATEAPAKGPVIRSVFSPFAAKLFAVALCFKPEYRVSF